MGTPRLVTVTSESALPGTIDISVVLRDIRCSICGGNPFYSGVVKCNSCLYPIMFTRVTDRSSRSVQDEDDDDRGDIWKRNY